MDKRITARQRELLDIIYHYIQSSGYPPTIEEMRTRLRVKSNQSIIDLLHKLEQKQLIRRNGSGARSLAILPIGYKTIQKEPLVPFVGTTHAGPAIPPVEITGEWQVLPGDVTLLKDEIMILKIRGDSMINAGIDDGDLILVKKQQEFLSGDIVLAEVDGESTVKRFISDDKPPYLCLKPENPNHRIILFTSTVELKGKVISVIKDGHWKSVH